MVNNCWMYQGECVDQIIEPYYGFVYRVVCLIPGPYFGYDYCGSKSFYSNLNTKISKKKAEELYSGRGARKTRLKVQKESNWLNYCTSSKYIQELIQEYGSEMFSWEIIDLGINKAHLSLLETKHIINGQYLERTNAFNYWLSCRIYAKNLPK